MLKKRIAATLVLRDGIVVQSIGFNRYLPIGKPNIAVEFLNQWGVDEIILLDISASRKGQEPNYALVRNVSVHCRVPLTVGGGITHIDHISELMQCGADKISLNQSALSRPELIADAAHLFGAQSLIGSIDATYSEAGYRVYDYLRRKPLDRSPAEFARKLEELGVGEILINSVDRDGSYRGFDLDLISCVCDAVSLPVICCGGAGSAQDFVDVFRHTSVSAASAANFFHFTEHSVTTSKALIKRQIHVRHETHANYEGSRFDVAGRLLKKEDLELENLLFIRIEKEVI